MLDLRSLRVLSEVARCGSLSGAARALNYTQPAITHHIARLERNGDAARHAAPARRHARGRAGRGGVRAPAARAADRRARLADDPGLSMTELACLLADERRRLDQLEVGQTSVRTQLAAAQAVSGPARQALALLAAASLREAQGPAVAAACSAPLSASCDDILAP